MAHKHACRKYPEAPLHIVGFSLGALLLTKYLCEEAQDLRPPIRLPVVCDVRSKSPAQPEVGVAAATMPTVAGAASPSWIQSDSASDGTGEPSPRREGGEARCSGRVTAAAVVGCPFDMQQAAANISKPWTLGWLYNYVLTFRCSSSVSSPMPRRLSCC